MSDSPIEEVIKSLVQGTKTVLGVVVIKVDHALIVRSTFPQEEAVQLAALYMPLFRRCQGFLKNNTPDEFCEKIRVRSRKYEMIISERDGFMLLVMHQPQIA